MRGRDRRRRRRRRRKSRRGAEKGLTESALLKDRQAVRASVGRSPDKHYCCESGRRGRSEKQRGRFTRTRREEEQSRRRVFWQQELVAAKAEEML